MQALHPWFALTIHPKHEHLAARGLRSQGFEVYLPVHRARRRWSDRTKTLDIVLFPGYVFCRFDPQDKLRVVSAPSVRGIVRNGRDPIPVDDAEIASVRTLISSGRPIDVCPFLRVGQHVRIHHGPFESVRGVIVRADDNWRVVVSVEALGCSVSVEVDADQVLPERKPPATQPTERITHGHLQA
jgi:transcription termination/antitermination protein NusG